jgi:5-formyltetrahydrofolate cyclo-ligase
VTEIAPLSDKTALRAHMRKVRAAAAQIPGAAEAAADQAPIDILAEFKVASGYWACGSELSALPLLTRLGAQGVIMSLPIAKDRHSPLTFRRWSPDDPMPKDAFDIPSPAEDAEEVFPTLVITPLLAFDRRGGRLGQGAGHYDRTIEALRQRGPVFVLGLAYAAQEIEQAPLEPHDQPLDGVLTEDGYIPVRRTP